MKIDIFTKDDGPESREALAVGTLLAEEGSEVANLEWDSEEAKTLAQLYDIYSVPAVLVTSDSGLFIELWQGEVPSVSDVRYKANNA